MYIIASISPADLVLLFIIALVIFGPKRLPEVGRQVGLVLRDLRKLSQEFTGALMGLQDQVHGSVAPLVSNVTGLASTAIETASLSDLPGAPGGEHQQGESSPDLMASKAEFGDEQSHRSRRGVTLSTLPPES